VFVTYHPLYTDGLHPDARFPRERYKRLAEALAGRVPFVTPRQARRAELLLAHDPSYVDAFLHGELDRQAMRKIGLRPWTPSLVPRTLHLTGAAIQMVDHVLANGGYAGNMAGGTHHAFRDHGSGYCIFNDLAIAGLHAVRVLGLKRVQVIDLDVHQGDGTAAILANEPRVQTLSVHCKDNFPFTKQHSDVDLELPQGTEDADYLQAIQPVLDAAFAWEPELVLYQGGVDPLREDKLGKLNLSRQGLQARNEAVYSRVDAAAVPCVVFMGGGYSRPIERSVEALVDLFSQR